MMSPVLPALSPFLGPTGKWSTHITKPLKKGMPPTPPLIL